MSTADEPLVYVLTPVYNGEEFLVECVESLLGQTYKNFRHVIINNCSKDRTLEIAQQFASRDARVSVITNETFVGLMENHNIAFRQTPPEAKYCKILSADDILFPDYLERMVAAAERNPSAGFVGCYQIAGKRIRWQGFPFPTELIDGRALCREMLHSRDPYFGFGTPTSMLFRADLVRSSNAFYPNNFAHADTSVCYRYLSQCNFAFVYQVLCMERLSPDSATPRAARMREEFLCTLGDLKEYGRAYLGPQEYAQVEKKLLSLYHQTLAADLMALKGKDFLEYHRQRLAALGYPLKTSTLLKAAGAKVLSEALNPAQFVEKVKRRLGKSTARVQA